MDRLDDPMRVPAGDYPGDTVRRARAFFRTFGIADARIADAYLRRRPLPADTADVHGALAARAARWFEAILGSAARTALAEGRVAWLAAGAPRRWATSFLGETPPELVAALRAVRRDLPPPILGTAMAAAELSRPRFALRPRAARLRRRHA